MRHPEIDDRLALQGNGHAEGGTIWGYQRWSRLLFLHWRVEPEVIQATLPPGLHVDTHERAAYVGIVPFRMERVRPRWLPAVPGISWFLELNVRTYVHDLNGRPGVYFYSLDCNQPLAVALARRFFFLPYYHADMLMERMTHSGEETVSYHCSRRGLRQDASYRWQSPLADTAFTPAMPGTEAFFLVERYLLFTQGLGDTLKCGRVQHRPYQVAPAVINRWSATPARQAGFELEGPPVSALAARPVDVKIGPLRSVQSVL
jgi:uncharacterized protein